MPLNFLQAIPAPVDVCIEDHFCIRIGFENIPLIPQFGTEFQIIVYLAVVGNGVMSVVSRHRLVAAGGDIYDGQAAMPEPHVLQCKSRSRRLSDAVKHDAGGIAAPMRHSGEDDFYIAAFHLGAVIIEYSCYAAHGSILNWVEMEVGNGRNVFTCIVRDGSACP